MCVRSRIWQTHGEEEGSGDGRPSSTKCLLNSTRAFSGLFHLYKTVETMKRYQLTIVDTWPARFRLIFLRVNKENFPIEHTRRADENSENLAFENPKVELYFLLALLRI